MPSVDHLIQHFKLQAHPEGGWFKQTYKSEELITPAGLPRRFNAPRSFSTAILFLLEQGNFSAFHRIKSDECWHFYSGDPLEIYTINEDGILSFVVLGKEFEKGQLFQYVVPANSWFASRPAAESSYSLVGCTVAPGFEIDDFELAQRQELCNIYPQHKALIVELTR